MPLIDSDCSMIVKIKKLYWEGERYIDTHSYNTKPFSPSWLHVKCLWLFLPLRPSSLLYCILLHIRTQLTWMFISELCSLFCHKHAKVQGKCCRQTCLDTECVWHKRPLNGEPQMHLCRSSEFKRKVEHCALTAFAFNSSFAGDSRAEIGKR